MTVKVTGIEQLEKNLEAVANAGDRASIKEVYRAMLDIQSDAKRNILQGAKTGTTYYRIPGPKYMVIRAGSRDGDFVAAFSAQGKQNLGLVHRSSASGESPANDTGELQRSIQSKMEINDKNKPSAVVWSSAKHAKYMEFGTKKIEPRPFLSPAVEKARKRFPKAVGDAVVKEIKEEVKT